MGAQALTAVADAGPLIHLYEIGHLDLLGLFDGIHVPDIVWREATGVGRIPPAELTARPLLVRHPLEEPAWANEADLADLHGGEKSALYLCARLAVPLLLTDDLAAREAAARRGITPVGSVGIVARSHRSGRIGLSEAESALARLYDTSSLFVSRTIVDSAIRALRCHKPAN